MAHPLFEKHQSLLRRALQAVRDRSYWSAYSENPKTYGENAIEEGRKAFSAYFDAQFYFDQPGVMGRVIAEQSPYGVNFERNSAETFDMQTPLAIASGWGPKARGSWTSAARPAARARSRCRWSMNWRACCRCSKEQ